MTEHGPVKPTGGSDWVDPRMSWGGGIDGCVLTRPSQSHLPGLQDDDGKKSKKKGDMEN